MTLTLAELIDQAERDGQWLYSKYHGMWFSPAELRTANGEGQFRWAAENFTVRDPAEYLSRLKQSKANLECEMREIEKRTEKKNPNSKESQ